MNDDADQRAQARQHPGRLEAAPLVATSRARSTTPVKIPVLRILAAMVVSVAMLLWAFVLWAQAGDLVREAARLRRRAASCVSPAPLPEAPRPEDTVDPTAVTQSLKRGVRLAHAPVRVVDEHGATKFSWLDDPAIVGRQQVTLVHLWASWCGPCLAELPRLKAALAVHSALWGDDLQFLPVLTEDPGTPEALLVKHRSEMPPFASFVADRPGFKEELVEKRLYRDRLPMSMLVGCDHQVRWIRFGELGDPEMPQLTDMISTLVAELRSHRCAGAPPPPVARAAKPPPDPKPPRCGDGRCGEGEDVHNCREDCFCGNGTCDGTEDARTCWRDCVAPCGTCPRNLQCHRGKCVDMALGF